MNSTLMRHIKRILRNYRRKKTWQKVVTVMAAVVVFITTYMLILPAITMETNLVCGKEEHTHTEECYETQSEQRELTCTAESLNIHQHTSDCNDANGVLICGYADYVVHTHDENCYDAEENLVCTLPEVKEHTHTDGCYNADGELICDQPEVILHEHTSVCYDEEGYLICGKLGIKAHQHSDDCFTVTPETKELVCEKEEHKHTDECYNVEDESDENSAVLLSDSTLPVTKISGNNTTYDPITDTFTTNVKIEFEFTAESEKPVAGMSYIYIYPSGVVVPDEVVNKGAQNLYDGDKLAGTYQFIKNDDGSYSVKVVFNENYVNEAGDTVKGYVQFEGSFSKEDMNEKGEIVVGADDATVLVPGDEITYPSDETESYNIDVSKSGSWVQDGDKLVYTVYIRTTKGTPNPIELEDTIINLDGVTLGNPTVTIEKGTANYYYADWDKTWKPTDNNNWSEVNDITTNYENGKLALSLPKLSAEETKDSNNSDCIIGDVYKITYSYPITDQTVADVFVGNKVTVTAEDEQKGQTVTDTAEASVDVNKDFSYTVDKSGAVASDKPGYIKWTVTVNNNEINIAGAKLTDEMLRLIENTANDIVVSPAEGASITKDENGKITDITFEGFENGVNKNKYTITYYTPVEESWNGTTVTNKATFDPNPSGTGDEKEASATVTVSGVKLFKTGQYNGATNKIEWTIVVNSNHLDIAGATLTDDMFATLSENDFTIEPEIGYSFTKNNDDKITSITFTEVENGKNTECYTIKYSTDVTKNDDETSSSVTNIATLSPEEVKEGTPISSESTVTPDEVQLTKSGQDSRWENKINWTITVNENNCNIAGAELVDDMFSQLKASEITVKDGNWQEVSADSTQYTIITDTEGNITKITFNAIGDTTVNTNKYIITYSTEAFTEWNDKIYHNEAKLTLDGKEIDAPADVTVYGDGSVSKSAGNATVSEDGKTATIPWTVTLTIPKGGLPAGTTLVDDVTKNQWGDTNTNQWMTRSQITTWATNLTWMDDNGNSVGDTNTYNLSPEQVTFLASNGNTYTYKQISEYNTPAGEGEVDFEELTYTLFTIYFTEDLIPPEGATKLTFTYSTTVDLTKTTTGGNKFYNDVQVGGKESSAEYTYYKPSIVKTDGNGSTDTTTVSNEGNLTWKVKATVGEGNKKLTLIDTLPEGVTLESLQLTGWGNLNMELTVDGETISGTDSTNQYTVSGTYKDGVILLDIVPQTEGNTIQTGAEFMLTVNCKVNDAENQDESKQLVNTAEMKLDDVAIGSSTQTQEWSYHKEEIVTKVVDKSGGWDNTNRIMNYTVILNQEGKDLLEGADTLTLVDTMTYTNQVWLYSFGSDIAYSINAALIQSSVKLYRAEWDESQEQWVAGNLVTDWSWTYEAKTGENDWDKNNATNTITATGIPDGTPLMLQYSYRITCNVPDEMNGQKTYFDLNFTNKATLEGTDYFEEHSSSNAKWEHSSESAGVTTDKSYTFYKVESGNYNVSLAGATFSVYKYDISTHDYDNEPVKTYSTNDNGSFQITRQEKDASGNETFTYDTNTLYKVTETAPPEGYKLPDEVKTFYFYFSSTDDTTHTLPDDRPSDAVDLTNEAKTVYVENVKNTTEITVEKKWFDKNGTEITGIQGGEISFDLYQIASTTPPSENSGSESGGDSGSETGVAYTAKCNSSTMTGIFNDVAVGDTVKISVDYTWQASSYNVAPSEWSGVSDGTGEYSNDGYTYDYTCKITSNPISFTTGDQESSIKLIRCMLVEKGSTTSSDSNEPDSGNSGDISTELEDTNIGTYTISNTDGWIWSKNDLPKTGEDVNGNTLYYTYYVVEKVGTNYSVSYDNNGGIASGTITIKNTESDNPIYVLPETGGPGTIKYIMGGILLMLASVLLYIKQHIKEGRRRHIRR